ncbi:MAG: TetR/AcrR family transcriptional regulator [Actinomycetota bacterium]|nr:TetR/AcrR family transcriptional regulator [Actinomycetota bacterium]
MSSKTASTRERIIASARGLLETNGYAGFGMEAIAEGAGVSRQAVYLHFGSKMGLLLALIEWLEQRAGLRDAIERIWSAPTALQALDRAVEVHARIDPEFIPLASALDEARRTDDDAAAVWRDRMGARYETGRRLIERLKHEGMLHPRWTVASATDFWWATMSPFTHRLLSDERGWSAKRYAESMKLAMRRALTTADAP